MEEIPAPKNKKFQFLTYKHQCEIFQKQNPSSIFYIFFCIIFRFHSDQSGQSLVTMKCVHLSTPSFYENIKISSKHGLIRLRLSVGPKKTCQNLPGLNEFFSSHRNKQIQVFFIISSILGDKHVFSKDLKLNGISVDAFGINSPFKEIV